MKTKILGVVGSLQRYSLTRCAVQYVLDQAKNHGAEVRMLDLLETPLPMFNPDEGGRSGAEYMRVCEHVNWANTCFLGTPDYHGSMSGVMKNFLDYFWKEFAGKLFGYVCTSHEKGLTPMDQMRTCIRQCCGWSMPYGACVTDGDFDKKSGRIQNTKVGARLDLVAYDLATYGAVLRKQFETDLSSSNPQTGFASHYRPGV